MQIAITNRGSNQIQPEIIKQMNNAQRSIWIAVAWFTDREIYNSIKL
jgi:phosphatidylserine/phosphatidylglycerophosphate/cardiolipin synthase-like enzyme